MRSIILVLTWHSCGAPTRDALVVGCTEGWSRRNGTPARRLQGSVHHTRDFKTGRGEEERGREGKSVCTLVACGGHKLLKTSKVQADVVDHIGFRGHVTHKLKTVSMGTVGLAVRLATRSWIA